MLSHAANKGRKPSITLAQSDHDKLVRLADANAHNNPLVSDELLNELDRARIVPDGRLADKIVRMGSAVTYQTDSGELVSVTLVYPAEADIAQGRISILTPIGTALIGLSPGQSIDWTARDGRRHRLTVTSVGSNADAADRLLVQ
ncbi:MAG: nucleoside diphosphate kinase regulator [Rhizobiaceae bacterium]